MIVSAGPRSVEVAACRHALLASRVPRPVPAMCLSLAAAGRGIRALLGCSLRVPLLSLTLVLDEEFNAPLVPLAVDLLPQLGVPLLTH